MMETTADVLRQRRAFFERTIGSMLPALYGAALRMAKNEADAEDLVATTVARAWGRIETLRDEKALCGWLLQILTNEFLAGCRKVEHRIETIAIDDSIECEQFSLFERLHQPILLWWGNPEQDFLNRLLAADLERAVDSLPEVFRTTVILVDLEGLSYAEAAEALQISIGTVRSRLARGRALLQQTLWRHAEEVGIRHTVTS